MPIKFRGKDAPQSIPTAAPEDADALTKIVMSEQPLVEEDPDKFFTDHVERYEQYYLPMVLKPKVHYRLVMNIDYLSRLTRVPIRYLINSSKMVVDGKPLCSPEEVTWILRTKFHPDDGIAGLAYVGEDGVSSRRIVERMFALCGVCFRNFLDARVYTLHDVLDAAREGTLPDCRVLAIPDFYTGPQTKLGEYNVSKLMSVLMGRASRGLLTIVFIQDMTAFDNQYGSVFTALLDSYTKVSAQ